MSESRGGQTGPRLISIVGGESTGKSTLAAALGAQLPAIVVAEYLRTWVDQHQGRVPFAFEQNSIMSGQHEMEMFALQQASCTQCSWVVADSGPLMTAVYSILYYDDTSLLHTALEWIAESDVEVWCQDDFPWQPDPQRSGVLARAKSQEILTSIFDEHPELPVVVVRGSLEQRLETVLTSIRAGITRSTDRIQPCPTTHTNP